MTFGNGKRRVSRTRCNLACTLCVAAFPLVVTTDALADAVAACAITSSKGLNVEDTAAEGFDGFGEFPVDLSDPVWDMIMTDEYTTEWGASCYANEEGRVIGHIITGADNDHIPGEAHVFVHWTKLFIRTPGTPDPQFTVLPSYLRMRADPHGIDEALTRKSFAKMRFDVRLNEHLVFKHRSGMEGQPSEDTFDFTEYTSGDAGRTSADGARSFHPASAGTDVVKIDRFAIYELPKYTQSIDLDRYGIGFGESYWVEYTLHADAGAILDIESWAEVFIGDPLDADSGFMLTTEHEPADGALDSCEATPDPNRFEDHGDGSITDSRTGLMWQRCPAGTALDDAGTPGDPSDDLCVADTDAALTFDWQTALQTAAADTLAGHDDWRAPNAKELESLVEPCSGLAQIDPLAFPGTPGSSFWTSTPEPGDSAPRRSWQLDFRSGDLSAASRGATAYLRPVRETGAMPVPAGVSVTAGNASVFEGDSGTTTLSLPVALSAPLGHDVSVDYAVSGLDAAEGDDFTATAGTLTIPAGDTVAYIDVTVMGDTDVEFNELVRLEISNQTGASWLRKAEGTGTIIDDEPILFIEAAAQVAETDGNEVANVVVTLDRPAIETVSIDYATANGTATAGDDYLAANGTVTIQPGDTEGVLPLTVVGDLVAEGVEQLAIEFDNATGAALVLSPFTMTVSIVDNDGIVSYGALNDTGVTTCATGDQAYIGCPQGGYPGQDGEHGRDVTDADPSDGALGFSFLKRDAAGDALADQGGLYSQAAWDCVEDQVTGLFWEVKNDIPGDLRFSDHTFTWYNSSGSNDGGSSGTANGGACPDGVNCDTEKYVAAVNAAELCGFDDWRLPSADELFNIAWLSIDSFSGIDTAYFPNHFAPPDGRGYWSATPSVLDSSSALRVRLDAGVSAASTVLPNAKNSTHRIRLVRGSSQSAQ